jgi:hypothetical protein
VSSQTIDKPASDAGGVSASSSYTGDGIFDIAVSNPNEKKERYYIHLDAQNFLWYAPQGFGSEYNESLGSSCSEHPCFEYKYGVNTQGEGVNSGTTEGVSFDLNSSKNSRGVRLYR